MEFPESPASLRELGQSLGLASSRGASNEVLAGFGLFAAGLALGVSLGMLFAPTSGRRLREELTDRVDRLRDPERGDDAGEARGASSASPDALSAVPS